MRLLFLLLLLSSTAALTACTSAGLPDDDDDDATEPPRPGPEYSGDTCPTLSQGEIDFATGDTSYAVRFELPDDPEGAPVVFVWHWLGGTHDQIVDWLEFDALTDEGAIVVAPRSSDSLFEWASFSPPEGNPDLLLFHDLLSCLSTQYTVDLDRVYATGMSAGGLWTSYLTTHGAPWLAATAPLSGGAVGDTSAAHPIPVMLTWGGPTDEAQGYDFHDGTQTLSQDLRDDGYFVIECEHDGGHTVPDGAAEDIWRFFEQHPAGAASPWSEALPDSLPDYCRLP